MKKVDEHRPTSVRWLILALSCGASFLLYLHRYTWGLISPELQQPKYGLNHKQTEFLFSLFYYTYAAGQIPSGVVIDRWGPRRFLAISILLWSLAFAALGGIFLWGAAYFNGSIPLVLLMVVVGGTRLLFGAAQAGCYPALTKASRVWFAPAGRTALQGLIASTAGRTGAATSLIIFGYVMMGWLKMSWEASILWLGVVGLAYGLLFWWLYADSPAVDPRVNDAERLLIRDGAVAETSSHPNAPAMLPWSNVLRSVNMRWFVCQQFCDAGSDVAFVSLMGKYFLQDWDLDIKKTAWLASSPLLAGAFGGLAGGWLNERMIAWTGNRRWSRSGVGFVGKVIGCLMLLLVTQQSSAVAAAGMLVLAKFFGDWSQPTVWGTCTDIGGRYSATVFSIINTSGTIGGMIMPPIFGWLLDTFTHEVTRGDVLVRITSWDPLFVLLAAMYLGSGLFWLLVNCTKSLETAVTRADAA